MSSELGKKRVLHGERIFIRGLLLRKSREFSEIFNWKHFFLFMLTVQTLVPKKFPLVTCSVVFTPNVNSGIHFPNTTAVYPRLRGYNYPVRKGLQHSQ